MRPCLTLYDFTRLRSYRGTDRKRMICAYEAPDTEAVRNVQREADAKFDLVWTADPLAQRPRS